MMPSTEDAHGHIAECIVFKFCKVHNLVVQRRLKLWKDKFITYRTSENDSHKPHKPKTWDLKRNCKLEPKSADDLSDVEKVVRPHGVWSIQQAALEGDKVKLYHFTIHWPTSWATRGYTKFGVGFKDRQQAAQWHALFESTIEALNKLRDRHFSNRTFQGIPNGVESDPIGEHRRATVENTAGLAVTTAALSSPPQPVSQATAPITQDLAPSETTTPGSTPRHPVIERLGSATGMSSPLAAPADIASTSEPVETSKERWVPYKHVNGVAIYYNRDRSSSLPEYMASSVVRGSPKACVDVLMNPKSNTTILGPANDVIVLPGLTQEAYKQMLQLRVEASGLPGRLLAPREMIVQRIYKKDDEGIHAVLFDWVDRKSHKSEAKSLHSWWQQPVRATVTGGYTIAPLEGQGDLSEECLVTCVLKVDLGGVCSERSFMWPIADMLGFKDAFVERMLMAVILVKDEVEHKRFVVQPFGIISAQAGGEEDTDTSSSQKRTATDIVGRGSLMVTNKALSRSVTASKSASGGSKRLPSQHSVADSQGAELEDPLFREPSVSDSYPFEFCRTGTVDAKYFHEIHRDDSQAPFRVRGLNYLKDRKKIPAGEPVFALGAVDLIILDEPIGHVARFLPSIRRSKAPFSFVTSMTIPGSPMLALVVTFVSDHHPSELGEPPARPGSDPAWKPFDYILHRFLNGDEDERNGIFKLIPHIHDGSWVIKQSVGATPVILGRKLKTKYHVTRKYIEMDVDISANATAAYVVSMVRGAIKSLSIDLGFVLEGSQPHELPEQLVGAARFNYMDMTKAVRIDMTKEIEFA